MPVLATAVAAGKTAFALLPKNKESRRKAAQNLSKGFAWIKRGVSKIQGVSKTATGYSVKYSTGDGTTAGKTSGTGTFDVTGFGKKPQQESGDMMKYAPYIIGALLLLTMKK